MQDSLNRVGEHLSLKSPRKENKKSVFYSFHHSLFFASSYRGAPFLPPPSLSFSLSLSLSLSQQVYMPSHVTKDLMMRQRDSFDSDVEEVFLAMTR